VRPVSQRRLNYLFSINKVKINGLVISHLCGFTTILPPATILLGILYLINPHTSDDQHKESCCRQHNGESNNQEANPPPPPLLTLEQVLVMQAQML
jgi:hypothetical protein